MARSAVIKKTKLPSQTNSVFFPSNNEKRKIYVQRDFLKREQSKPEHQAPNRYVEVGTNSLHRIPDSNIVPNPRQQICPAAADTPKGSGEVSERDRGSKSPVSFQPPPRGADKIYTYDVVFRIGEARINDISQT